jgi:hypothetical protein
MLEPGRYEGLPAYTLLESAARGYIAVDRRFLHAILDHPDAAVPDLIRFALEEHADAPVDLDLELMDIFRHLGTPEALPFFVELVRRNPSDVSDELVEAFVQFGAAAVGPLLDVLQELEGGDAGDVLFLLAALRVRDARILNVLTQSLETDPLDAAICLDIYGDAAAIPQLEAVLAGIPQDDPRSCERLRGLIDSLSSSEKRPDEAAESFDIWELYPQEDLPDLGLLGEEERLAVLGSGPVLLRAEAARSFEGSEPSPDVTKRLVEFATSDPDLSVRGACWEALASVSNDPKLRADLLGVLRNADASLEEQAGAAVALARNYEFNPTLVKAIEALYDARPARAKALKAMAYSLDGRFAAYPPRHLEDPDAEVKRQAISGIGYLQLSSEAPRLEAFFDHENFRLDALFAYALSVPAETSPGRAHALLDKVEKVAGGFREDEEDLVKFALDQRLMLRGKRPCSIQAIPRWMNPPRAHPRLGATTHALVAVVRNTRNVAERLELGCAQDLQLIRLGSGFPRSL